MYVMPQHFKDWITSSRSRSASPPPPQTCANVSQEEHAGHIYVASFDPDPNSDPNLGPLLI